MKILSNIREREREKRERERRTKRKVNLQKNIFIISTKNNMIKWILKKNMGNIFITVHYKSREQYLHEKKI